MTLKIGSRMQDPISGVTEKPKILEPTSRVYDFECLHVGFRICHELNELRTVKIVHIHGLGLALRQMYGFHCCAIVNDN